MLTFVEVFYQLLDQGVGVVSVDTFSGKLWGGEDKKSRKGRVEGGWRKGGMEREGEKQGGWRKGGMEREGEKQGGWRDGGEREEGRGGGRRGGEGRHMWNCVATFFEWHSLFLNKGTTRLKRGAESCFPWEE